jgi:hypothetical protein
MTRGNWLFKDGCLLEGTPLGEMLDQMTEHDVYIKGANAMDPVGNVAVLFGNSAGGGTIGKVIKAKRRIGFHMLLPIGLEKRIPIPIATGGLGGAEGSVVLAMNGAEEQVRKAFEICRSVKGAALPTLKLLDCDSCRRSGCHFAPDHDQP